MLHPVAALLPFLFAAQVQIVPPRTQIVPARASLEKLCGSDGWIYGCTRFLGEKLTVQCTADGDTWRMSASAQFIPYVYLWQPDAIGHEMLHIDDLRLSTAGYLRSLENVAHDSATQCEAAGRLAGEGFPGRMDEWKKASNARRHPSSKHARELRRARVRAD